MIEIVGCIVDGHALWLVVLAGVVCTLASQTSFSLLHRAERQSGRQRQFWLAAAALAMGCGVWATHFVAMMAYSTPWPVGYDELLTALSAAIAVAVSGLGLWLALRISTPLAIAGGSDSRADPPELAGEEVGRRGAGQLRAEAEGRREAGGGKPGEAPHQPAARGDGGVAEDHRREQHQREAEGGGDGGDRGGERALDAVGGTPGAASRVILTGVREDETGAAEIGQGRRRTLVALGFEDERRGGEVLQHRH